MKLAQLASLRPDMLYHTFQAAKAPREMFKEKSTLYAYSLHREDTLETSMKTSIRFPKLNQNILRLILLSETSSSNNHDSTAQPDLVSMLSDRVKFIKPLAFKSYKSRIVIQSVLGAQPVAFVNLFDEAIAIRNQIWKMLKALVPL